MISHSPPFVFGGKTISQMRTPEITAHVAVNVAAMPLNITTHMHAKNTHDITATATQIAFVALSILMKQDRSCRIVVDATLLPPMERGINPTYDFAMFN